MGFWNVKEGFQNIREEDFMRELEKLDEGKNWTAWVKRFFRARMFKLN